VFAGDNGVIFLIIGVVVAFLMALKGSSGGFSRDAVAVKIPTLLTPAELSFYNYIFDALDSNEYVLCTKVRLGDLVKFRGGDDKQRWKRLQQVNRKHIDFVVCSRKSMMPVFLIELDDSSHNRKDRKDRDHLVDSFLSQACLPILHVRCQRYYNPEVRQAMQSLSEDTLPSPDILENARAKVHGMA